MKNAKKVDIGQIDFTKQDTENAGIHGCSRELIRQKRYQGAERASRPVVVKAGDVALDIADHFRGLAEALARRLTKFSRSAPPAGAFLRVQALHNSLAEVLGDELAGALVRNHLPTGRFLAAQRHTHRESAKARLLSMDVRGCTTEQVAQEAGCSAAYARQILEDLGRGSELKPAESRRRSKYRWETIKPEEWQGPKRLSDKEIATRLGIGNPAVVYQYRRRKKIMKGREGKERMAFELVLQQRRDEVAAEVPVEAAVTQ